MSTQLNVLSPVVIVGMLIGLVVLALGWFWLVRLFASVVDGPLNPSNESMTQVHVDNSPALASVTSQQPLTSAQATTAPSSMLLPMLSEQKADQDKRPIEASTATAHFIETTSGTTPVAEDTQTSASNLPAGAATVTTALTSPGATILATPNTAMAENSTTSLLTQRPWQQRQPQPLRRRQPLGKETIRSLRVAG